MRTQTRLITCGASIAAAVVLAGCQQSSNSAEPTAAPPPSTTSSTGGAAPSGTDPKPYEGTGGSLSFLTPWGAWCGIIPRNAATPDTRAAGCWEITGRQQVLSVSPTSKAAVRQVQQGFFVQLRGPVLPAGSVLEVDGVRCTQSATDLTCTAGEHGFTLRPDNSMDLH